MATRDFFENPCRDTRVFIFLKNHYMTFRRQLVIALCALVVAGAALGASPLRVCADPDNLPFSKSEGPERGLYIELAELLAKKITAEPVQYTWWATYNQRRALRNTAGDCDAVFALPTDADYRARGLQKSTPFLNLGYALVSAPGFTFANLTDLKGKRLGVQFQTNPHVLLSQRDDLPFTTYRGYDEVFAALAKGEIDAGFVWGPVAGFDNQRKYASRWKVTPLNGKDLTGQVAIAVRRDKPELLKEIDAALDGLKAEIAALAVKYGFPQGNPVNLTIVAQADVALPAAASATRVPGHLMVLTQSNATDDAGKTKRPAAKPKAPASTNAAMAATGAVAIQEAVAQAPALSPTALLGRTRFNDQCAHCHGADGASPVRERDLRRLKMRYDARWKDTALTTIKNGRPDAGMPPWKDILKEPDLDQILSFIETVQK